MFEPFQAGSRFRIVPPGTTPARGRIDLTMARGAFGSGEHETTLSCLELLEELPSLPSARVLDFGSGTGILSLAALKLGAAAAICVDISSQAVANCRHNCALNSCAEQVNHLCGSLADLEASGFDLVLANIYGDLLLRFASDLAGRVRAGGWLLLSGILWEDNYAVRQTYESAGCQVRRNRMLDDYSTILLQRC